MKHAPDIGLTIIDLIAPFFIFAVGLTFVLSAQRRFNSEGWRKMAVHLSKRSLALIGLGALITTGENYFDITPSTCQLGCLTGDRCGDFDRSGGRFIGHRLVLRSKKLDFLFIDTLGRN